MDPTTLGSVTQAVFGRLVGAEPDQDCGPDVVVDSRLATSGSVFIALPGEHTDGHHFLDAAAAAGAAVAIIERDVQGMPTITVESTAQALADLAATVVREATTNGLTVIGITGSVGKTTTKDLLAQVLAAAGETVAPEGSYNNEVGVPLTALRVRSSTRFLVSELGARGAGHIDWLCDIVSPTIGLVLNVGSAHLGEFGGADAIAAAKGELIEALPTDGWAVLNSDDPRVAEMAPRSEAQLAWFSVGQRPDRDGALLVWASDLETDEGERYHFNLQVQTGGGDPAEAPIRQAPVTLQLVGRHLVTNAVAAATVALAAGLDLDLIARSLSTAQARSKWRMEISERPDHVMVINDAYNANPESMRAALEAASGLLKQRQKHYPGAMLATVLGDMLELGDESANAHRELGTEAAAAGARLVLAVGEYAQRIVDGAAAGGADAVRLARRSEAAAQLTALRAGDIVLIKASRGVGLESVALDLLEPPC